jgi:hypothetical protein
MLIGHGMGLLPAWRARLRRGAGPRYVDLGRPRPRGHRSGDKSVTGAS